MGMVLPTICGLRPFRIIRFDKVVPYVYYELLNPNRPIIFRIILLEIDVFHFLRVQKAV